MPDHLQDKGYRGGTIALRSSVVMEFISMLVGNFKLWMSLKGSCFRAMNRVQKLLLHLWERVLPYKPIGGCRLWNGFVHGGSLNINQPDLRWAK